MRPAIPIFCIMGLSACLHAAVESQNAPALSSNGPRTEEQFAMLWQRSPFVLSSVETVSDLARRYSISGVAMLGDKPCVFIRDNKDQRRYGLSEVENDDGMRLVRLMENDDPLKVKATVLIAGREGTLTYDAQALKTAATPSPEAVATPEEPENPTVGTRRRRPMRGQHFPTPPNAGDLPAIPSVPVIPREPISPTIEEPDSE